MLFEVGSTRRTDSTVVRIRGELDIATEGEMARELDDLDEVRGQLYVDLTEVEFIDSGATRVIMNAARRRARDGGTIDLVCPKRNTAVTLVLDMLGVPRVLTVHEELPADGGAGSGS